MLKLRDGIVELYRKVAISVPKDIEEALNAAYANESEPQARASLEKILQQVSCARSASSPVCVDTGFPVFFVKVPRGLSHKAIIDVILDATRLATKKVPLMPNAVNSITGINTGDNVGDSFPAIYIDETDEQSFTVDLMLKGGRTEALGRLYRLPAQLGASGVEVRADRDFDGIARCVADAVLSVRGEGCPPFMIGVAVGGARDQVTALSAKQLMRRLHDVHPDPAIAGLEARVLDEINGLGGERRMTALGVKIGAAHRHPESYFVDVSFACWSHRRGRLVW